MAIYAFNGFIPVIHPSAFIHPQASIIGDVIIGKNVYVGPGARIRGDWGQIVIEDDCNVQENCVIHMFPGVTVYLRKMAHIGHGAIIHGANIGENTLVGMNAVIMDESNIGAGCIVGALTFIKQASQVPERSMIVGNPARIIRQVSQQELDWKTQGTQLYTELPAEMGSTLIEVVPLLEIENTRRSREKTYSTKKS